MRVKNLNVTHVSLQYAHIWIGAGMYTAILFVVISGWQWESMGINVDPIFPNLKLMDKTTAGWLSFGAIFLMGARNKIASDRWWEGRKIWGGLINDSRNAAAQGISMVEAKSGSIDGASIAWAKKWSIYVRLFPWVLNHSLRSDTKNPEVLNEAKLSIDRLSKELGEDLSGVPNQNSYLNFLTGKHISEGRRLGIISEFHEDRLRGSIHDFYIQQGKCERIKKTPLFKGYGSFIELFVFLHMFFLPFALIPELGGYSIITVVLVAYIFNIIREIGSTYENPFEGMSDDMPMDAMSRTIERDIAKMINDPDPEAIGPSKGILM